MKPYAILLSLLWLSAAAADEPRPVAGEDNWRLRLSAANKTYLVRPDGTDRQETKRTTPPKSSVRGNTPGELSPDGTHRVLVTTEAGNWVVKLSDADGGNSKSITRSASQILTTWSPDGKHLAYTSGETTAPQIYIADADGANAKQITQETFGAFLCRYGPGGQLAYIVLRGPPKVPPTDLVVRDDKGSRAIVTNTFISDFAWSPDGKAIAYTKCGSLVFHDLESGAEHEVEFKKIDSRLYSHVAWKMNWRPDNQAIVCSIMFLGGRQEGTQMFGDDEIFVIPREGQVTWFTPSEKIELVEWAAAK